MAGNTGRKAAAKAQAPRIGAEYGLGQYLGTFGNGKPKGRLGCGFVLLYFGVPCLIVAWEHGRLHVAELVAGCVLLGLAIPCLRFPWGSPQWLHHYEGGLAKVTDEQVSVLPWVNLGAVNEHLGGEDDELLMGYDLTDRWGTEFISVSASRRKFRPIVEHARQVLAERRTSPASSVARR